MQIQTEPHAPLGNLGHLYWEVCLYIMEMTFHLKKVFLLIEKKRWHNIDTFHQQVEQHRSKCRRSSSVKTPMHGHPKHYSAHVLKSR